MFTPKWSLLMAGAVLVAGCAGSGSPPATGQAPALADSATDDPYRMVCKSIQKTGTRLGTRHCFTQARWDEMQRRSQDSHEEIQRRASQHQDMPGQGN